MTRVLGWMIALVGVVCLLIFAAASALLDEAPAFVKWIGGGGVGLLVLWLVADWKNLARMGEDQTVGRSFVAAFAVVLMLAIVVVVNIAIYRYDDRWDLTAEKRYTLSQQSIDIASKLDRNVEVFAFFQTTEPGGRNFRALMDEYLEHTTLLTVSHHDPYQDNLLADQMKILSASGTIILKSGEKEQRLETDFGEEAFTNALVRVTSDVQHTVCVTTGHGERDPDDEYSQDGLGIAKISLEGQNYRLSKVSVLDTPPTPAECEIVLVPGPRTDLLPTERDRLAAYVAGGGRLIVLLDPFTTPETAADLARYGIAVGNDVVIEGDPNRQTNLGPTTVLLDPSSFDISPITQRIEGAVTLFQVRSVGKGPDIAGINVQELARSTDQSWGETKLDDPAVPPQPDAGADRMGPVPLVATAEITDPTAVRLTTEIDPAAANLAPIPGFAPPVTPAPAQPIAAKAGGKVAVFGDSEFAANFLVSKYNNQDFLLNTIAWMAGEEDQLSVRPNEAKAAQLELDGITVFLSGVLMLLLNPALTVGIAFATWMRRRQG